MPPRRGASATLLAGVALALVATTGVAQRPTRPRAPTASADTASVVVTRPTVIAYLVVPPGAVDTSEALAVTADDWNYAMATLGDSLAAHGIALALETGPRLRIVSPGTAPVTFELAGAPAAGYVFVRPGRPPCIRRGAAEPGTIVAAARAFFEGDASPAAAPRQACGGASGGTSGGASSLAPPPRFEDPERLARLGAAFPAIDSLMRAFAERSRVPGMAYGIVVDGRLAHVGVAGLRELSSRAPVDSATVFRIASMTKSFTALAILQLRDAGRLSLDDPVERHVPELAALRYPTADSPRITIRHLLSHSAGFPEDNPWGDQQLAVTNDEMAAMLRGGIPFSTAPGTSYEYSNYGFAILGRVVANVSGMPYPRYVVERVLRPLGMTSTTLEAADVPADRLAHGYRRQDDRWLEEPQLPDGAFGPMGGMLTSVGDLGRWVAFLLDAWPPRDDAERGPVRRASVREMQQVARYNGATAVRDTAAGTVALSAGGYGYGLGVRQSCLFPVSVSHSGGLPGFGSLMRWLPEHGVGIVALGNLTYTGWGGVVDRAFGALHATGGLVPRAPQPAPVLAELREQVTRLVTRWDDALADSVAAMNLYRDESKARRRAAIERLRVEAGDDCRAEGPFVVENALRGRWRMRCARGDLRVAITLAPTEPARVQYLDVTPMARDETLASAPACR